MKTWQRTMQQPPSTEPVDFKTTSNGTGVKGKKDGEYLTLVAVDSQARSTLFRDMSMPCTLHDVDPAA